MVKLTWSALTRRCGKARLAAVLCLAAAELYTAAAVGGGQLWRASQEAPSRGYRGNVLLPIASVPALGGRGKIAGHHHLPTY